MSKNVITNFFKFFVNFYIITKKMRFFSFLQHSRHKLMYEGSFWKLFSVFHFWTFLKMSIFIFGHDFLSNFFKQYILILKILKESLNYFLNILFHNYLNFNLQNTVCIIKSFYLLAYLVHVIYLDNHYH